MSQLLEPSSAVELAEALGAAAASGKSIEAGGNFTKSRWAGPPRPSDVRISTARMNRVLTYEPKDLTISVQAGMPFAELNTLLAGNHQMIPLDPPYASKATVGGVIAANHSGPRRRLYGTARDLVIGMQFATVDGKLVNSGGMVVKNVAGLDMGKLMIGSWGTLSVIASVNFKLIPAEQSTRTFVQSFATVNEALSERTRVLQSVLQPAAMDLVSPPAAKLLGWDGWLLVIAAAGSIALVERYARELPGFQVLDPSNEQKIWQGIETFAERFLAVHADGAIIRLSATLQGLCAAIRSHSGPLIARAANGVAYLFHERAPHGLKPPKGAWPQPDCHMIVDAGPRDRNPSELWPGAGSELAVMENLKRMLDPNHLLNKGRFYGRI